MPLRIHFLNVGRGDCTLIEFPSGHVGVVDIDHLKVLDPDTRAELLAEFRETSQYRVAKAQGLHASMLELAFLGKQQEQLTDPLEYYERWVGEHKNVFRMIVTHPDMDHMTGLYRLHEQDVSKDIVNFWHAGFNDFNLARATDDEWEKSPYDKRDWQTYKKLRRSEGSPKSLRNHQGDTGDFWTQDGIEIWAPTPALEKVAAEKDESNILSTVLRVTYRGRAIVLGGDATGEETWPAIYPDIDMSDVDVLKASHHGRKTGYYGPAVKEMSPWLTITSVGEKEHDATENYRRYSTYTVSLRKAGDIRITIDDSGKLLYSPNIETYWKPQRI